MKRLSLGLCAALGAAWLGAPAARAESGFFPFPVEQKQLKNGLTVVAIPLPGTGLVGVRTTIRTGSRDEYEPGRTGFAHFFEHMMFRGTKKYPADVYSRLITEIGADTNAYTSNDVTNYLLNIAAPDLEKVMELESDRFQNLAYPKASFETEAGAVYGEYRKNRSSPFFTLEEEMSKTAFTTHTYGHTTLGYEKDIKAMPKLYDYSRSFFDRYYRPDNAILLVAGDVEPARVFALAEKYWSSWKPGYVAPKVKPEPEQKKARRVNVSYDGQALPILWIGWKGDAFAAESREFAAAHVLAELAFGETSPIYQDLVLDRQLVESLSVQPPSARDADLFNVIAVVKNVKDLPAVEQQILRAVTEARTVMADQARLEEIKSHMRYGFLMGLASADDVAGTISHLAGVWGGVDAIERFYQTIAKVSPEDVKTAANRYLSEAKSTTAILKSVK